MAGSFAKIYAKIVSSSIWEESLATRVVWVAMLATADVEGNVYGTPETLARIFNVSVSECKDALEVLMGADRRRPGQEHDGRRLEPIDGGWHVLNLDKYRTIRTPTQVKTAQRVAAYRSRQALHVTDDRDSNGRRDKIRSDQKNPPIGPPGGTKPKQARRWRRIPESWEPNQSHHELAAKLGVNLAQELEAIRDHEYATAKSDPDACFRTWLRNAAKFRGNGRAGKTPIQPNRGVDVSGFCEEIK